jgi:membrane protease YdiL (CAAX protease family)
MQLSAEPQQPPNASGPVIGGRPVEWTLKDIALGSLWFVGLFVVFPLPFVLPFVGIFGEDATETFISGLVLGAFSELGLIAVAVWFTFRKYGGSWERLGFKRPSWSVLGWAAAAIAGALAFNAAYGGIIELFDIEALRTACDDQVPRELQDSRVALIVASVVFITFAPVCEEIFFRGFMFPGFWRYWGVALAAVASGLLFSIAHVGPNMHKTIIPIFAIGAIFALAYWKSGNILTTMLAHFAQNALAVSLLWATECDPS